MLKAIVVGGSNGIGLAISKKLTDDGYFVYILDKSRWNRELCLGLVFENSIKINKH